MQLDKKANKKELITNNYLVNNTNYLENISESYYPLSNKKFKLFKKFTKSKLKFNITKKLVYSLSIVSCLLILDFLFFLFSQYRKGEIYLINNLFTLEHNFFKINP